MDVVDRIVAKARAAPRRIAFPEPDDPRVLEAAGRLAADGVVHPVVVGPPGGELPPGVEIVDPSSSSRLEEYAATYQELTQARGTGPEEAHRAACDPLTHATLMIRAGEVDGSVAGARHTTAETLRAALRVIRPRDGIRTVSTFFLMVHPDESLGHEGAFIFADCGLVEEPSADQLAEIALMSAHSARRLLGCEPRVALLSYSSHGSAEHPTVTRVRQAVHIIRGRNSTLCVDGELQLDAAIIPEVAATKVPDSPLAGRANVLIFPDLNSGNIGYKLVERLGRARALGPVTQGLRRPANDLSRGCSVQDIYEVAAITSVLAGDEEALA